MSLSSPRQSYACSTTRLALIGGSTTVPVLPLHVVLGRAERCRAAPAVALPARRTLVRRCCACNRVVRAGGDSPFLPMLGRRGLVRTSGKRVQGPTADLVTATLAVSQFFKRLRRSRATSTLSLTRSLGCRAEKERVHCSLPRCLPNVSRGRRVLSGLSHAWRDGRFGLLPSVLILFAHYFCL